MPICTHWNRKTKENLDISTNSPYFVERNNENIGKRWIIGVGEETNQCSYYEKMDSASYVFFNIGFDDTKIYYSDKKEWKDEP